MAASPKLGKPILVSFSGLDGAGKTTQITSLREAISHLGLRSQVLTFWDDVVVCSCWRQSFVNNVLGSEQGVGVPGRPVRRCDKNVRAGYLTLARHLLYLADALNLRLVLHHARRSGAQVIITDRYIYDELANLPLENVFSAAYAKLLAWIAPRPELALFLDADPETARARKPEYSVDFMRQSRRSYFRLAKLLGWITIVPPLAMENTRRAVLIGFLRTLGRSQGESSFAGVAPATEGK
jgi:thymidylate kinase